MSVAKVCVQAVVVSAGGETVGQAARRMAERQVGSLIIVDDRDRPLGILTDRDIVVRCVARGQDCATMPVSEVMTHPVHSVNQSTPISEALRKMAHARTRRLAVIGHNGRLVGIVAVDDALRAVLEEIASIGRLVASEPKGDAAAQLVRC